MHVMHVRNVNNAFPTALNLIRGGLQMGIVEQASRNGPVYRSTFPVTTIYERPMERILFDDRRNVNPFFHFMEGLWMIDGRNDVEWISRFNKNMASYSDDGVTFHGAYGYRWRAHWGFDQLERIADVLKKNPLDRRCVLTMWDPEVDLGHSGKDFPCNTQIYFWVSPTNCLDMMVTCRSNDVVWGAYGANVVHMSMLQEVMASMVGVSLGRYWQVSANWHAYKEIVDPLLKTVPPDSGGDDPYQMNNVVPVPMVQDPKAWFEDLHMFLAEGPVMGFKERFFRKVASPIYNAWMTKENHDDPDRWSNAIKIVDECAAPDLRLACKLWLLRRTSK